MLYWRYIFTYKDTDAWIKPICKYNNSTILMMLTWHSRYIVHWSDISCFLLARKVPLMHKVKNKIVSSTYFKKIQNGAGGGLHVCSITDVIALISPQNVCNPSSDFKANIQNCTLLIGGDNFCFTLPLVMPFCIRK